MDDRAICLPWDKILTTLLNRQCSLRRITVNLLKFTREYGDILLRQHSYKFGHRSWVILPYKDMKNLLVH